MAAPKGRRVQKIARRAVEKGFLTESQLRELRLDESTDADLSTILNRGWLTHAQLQELGDDETRPASIRADEHEPGETVAKYVLLRQIGSGGMGTVWLASDPGLDRFVAVKFLHQPTPEDARRFQREARLAAKLNHPNIAAVYEYGEIDGHPYLVMQYVDGKTLLDLRLPLQRTLRICRDAARALDAAHRGGIVHRDIKPHNLMVDKSGRVFIMDFGVAKRVSFASTRTPRGGPKPVDSIGDERDMIFGTPSYMSPEQVEGGVETDGRTDVYCLGATMYHVLTGQTVFPGSTVSEILERIVVRAPAPPSKLNGELPHDVDAIILKCLQKLKGRRYESARHLADDIDRYLRGEAVEAAHQTVGYKLSKHRGRLLRWMTAAAALVAAVALVWLALRPTRGSVAAAPPGDGREATARGGGGPRETGRLTVRGADVKVVDEKGAALSAAELPPGRYTAIVGDLRIPFTLGRLSTGEGESIDWEIPPPEPGMAFMPRAGSRILGTWIDVYEVTNAQYAEFLQREIPENLREVFAAGGGDPDMPVTGLDEIQAVRYLLAEGKRLPLRSEWLAAAQGVDDRAYPWGSASGPLESLDKPCGIRDLAKIDVSPFGVVGLASGAAEPVWVEGVGGGPVWPAIAWQGGYFGAMKDPVRFKATGEPAGWSPASGLRGARTSLGDAMRRDPSALEKLMQGKDLAARIEATVAAAAPGGPEVAIKQAAWDPSPFVAYPALQELVRRGEDLSKLFAGSNASPGTLYLAALAALPAQKPALCRDLERRYAEALHSTDRATQVGACAALLYLGEHVVDGRQILGEARALCSVKGAPNAALGALFARYAFRPGFDLGSVLDALLGRDQEAFRTQALGILEDVVERMESGLTAKDAYGLAERRPLILAVASDEQMTSATRARARKILDRMTRLGIQ